MGWKAVDIDVGNETIKVNGKGNKQRIVPMLHELTEEVKIYLQMRDEIAGKDHSFCFVTDKGVPVYD